VRLYHQIFEVVAQGSRRACLVSSLISFGDQFSTSEDTTRSQAGSTITIMDPSPMGTAHFDVIMLHGGGRHLRMFPDHGLGQFAIFRLSAT
jgi:hypothetical protein